MALYDVLKYFDDGNHIITKNLDDAKRNEVELYINNDALQKRLSGDASFVEQYRQLREPLDSIWNYFLPRFPSKHMRAAEHSELAQLTPVTAIDEMCTDWKNKESYNTWTGHVIENLGLIAIKGLANFTGTIAGGMLLSYGMHVAYNAQEGLETPFDLYMLIPGAAIGVVGGICASLFRFSGAYEKEQAAQFLDEQIDKLYPKLATQ